MLNQQAQKKENESKIFSLISTFICATLFIAGKNCDVSLPLQRSSGSQINCKDFSTQKSPKCLFTQMNQ